MVILQWFLNVLKSYFINDKESLIPFNSYKLTIMTTLRFFIILATLLFFTNANCQTTDVAPMYNRSDIPAVQSPSAASLGKFGDIPVSLYVGTPNITIQLAEIKSGNIIVPISLSYDASGTRPDQRPTWVGLNWMLNCGGVITRHKNGMMDEQGCLDYHQSYNHQDCTDKSYYNNKTSLAVDNWNSTAFLEENRTDLNPDEFSFNVNGIRGKFALDHTGKWRVWSSSSGLLKVESIIQDNYSVSFPKANVVLPRTFTKFILTGPDGTKYHFGEQPNAIEFSLSSMPRWAGEVNVRRGGGRGSVTIDPFQASTHITSSAWHLTQIVSASGHAVNFYYDSDYVLQQNTYTQLSLEPVETVPPLTLITRDYNQTAKFIVKSSYLRAITTDGNIVCNFTKSISSDLPQPFLIKPNSKDYFPFAFEVPDQIIPWKNYKLDNIMINANGTAIKKIDLAFTERIDERLKLSRVKFINLNNNTIDSEYIIEYNGELLPQYNSGEEDHWGFYNGKNFYKGISMQGIYTPEEGCQAEPSEFTDYNHSREPNAELMDAEIIKRITYPTGGFTDFIFEPHDYSTIIRHETAIAPESLQQSRLGGGLRIKQVKNYTALDDTAPVIHEYFYKKNYITGSAISSGVLNGEAVYSTTGSLLSYGGPYTNFNSAPLNYLLTNKGAPISYSEVTEKTGPGYTVYTFTNHDNGYADKQAFTKLNNGLFTSILESKTVASLNLERGLTASIRTYNETKTLVKEVLNSYNSNPDRYNEYIRAVINISGNYYSTRINSAAYPIYIFTPYLEKTTTTNYFSNASPVAVTTNYTYDLSTKQVKKISIINSDDTVINTRYKYPNDYGGNPQASSENEFYDIMFLLSNNVINIPVEITKSVNSGDGEFITESTVYHFEDLKLERVFELDRNSQIPAENFNGTRIAPPGFVQDPRYKEKAHFSKYDEKGNVLEYKSINNMATAYLYSYNSSYMVAEIKNATAQQIANTLGAASMNNVKIYFDNALINNLINQLRTSIPESQIKSYNHVPGIGLVSETGPNGSSMYYSYDHQGRLKEIKNTLGEIVKEEIYNYRKFKRLSVNSETIDFGSLVNGSSTIKKIIITNTGNLPVSVYSIAVPSYLTHDFTPFILNPGQNKQVVLTFSPGTIGIYNYAVPISSDAENITFFNITAKVLPTKIINLSGDLTFYSYAANNMPYFPQVTKNLVVKNFGNGPLIINEIILPTFYSTSYISGSIPAGQTINIPIKFMPLIPPPIQGSYSASFPGIIRLCTDKTSGSDTIEVKGFAIKY